MPCERERKGQHILRFICLYLSVVPSVSTTAVAVGKVRLPRAGINECRLPEHPKFGKWAIYEKTTTQIPGDLVASGTTLELSCQDNYKLDDGDITTCVYGRWKPKISKCLRTCPTINNTPFMSATCTFNDNIVKNCAGAIEGTIAKFSCADFYEKQELNPFTLCSNGNWGKIPKCVPVCGKKSFDPTLIVGATNTHRAEYPWQIALYTITAKSLICGGTLLSERMVLTAAHCVTDDKGQLLPKEDYMVAAGKYYREFDDHRDFNKTQFSSVSKMFSPREYRADLQNYLGDIAILVAEKTFVLSFRVQPVCIDWDATHFQDLLRLTKSPYGFVTGWGFTAEYKNPSEILKVLKVPIIDEGECDLKFPSDYKRLLTSDKLCAGFLNSSTSVCKGDSGGGLVYEVGGKYYLLGIVSVAAQSATAHGGCNSQLYTLYTNVSHYTEKFILNKEAEFRPSIFGNLNCNYDPNCGSSRKTPIIKLVTKKNTTENEGKCIVPPSPQFGKWLLLLGPDPDHLSISPGDSVDPGTPLTVQCGKNYKLEAINATVCFGGGWTFNTGRCVRKLCPFGTPNRDGSCTENTSSTEGDNCIIPPNPQSGKWSVLGQESGHLSPGDSVGTGKALTLLCDKNYKVEATNATVCYDGTWTYNTARCVLTS